ncbi:hypothetical protein F4778DRAFT_328368 [Xylariomycetidae sp. FL2044]|nr:hypothetical protein F4778DRAFT_328368 [Xylariomycetidae sp. FL2044]
MLGLLFTFAGLTTARLGNVEVRQEATSTIKAYAHPLSLSPLSSLATAATPLSYATPPTRISVTSDAQETDGGLAAKDYEVVAPATATTTASIATSSLDDGAAKCTSIAGDYPTTTVPSFCAPSILRNAPELNSSPALEALPLGNFTVDGVADKLECCARCATVYNCVAWQFVPAYAGEPSDALPGGYDPWGRGDCDILYHTGTPGAPGYEGNVTVTAEGEASVCPNGVMSGLLAGSENPVNGTTWERSWSNLYYNGWNEGACGMPDGDRFVGGTDLGYDASALCEA